MPTNFVVSPTPVNSSILTPNILPNAALHTHEFKDPRQHGTLHGVNETKCENVNYSAAHMGLRPLYRSVNTFKRNSVSTQHARFTLSLPNKKMETFQKQTERLKHGRKMPNI